MKQTATLFVVLFLLVSVSPLPAITPSDDLIIPGAARTRLWVDDLYINNPGDSIVTVEVFWLIRGQANPDPVSKTIDIGPGATHITWTVSFAIDDNLGFAGTVSAVGADFTDVDEGCNGTFPSLFFEGGKGR